MLKKLLSAAETMGNKEPDYSSNLPVQLNYK